MNKSYPIGSLQDGTLIESVNLSDITRYLRIERVSDSSTQVSGQKREALDTPWEPFTEYWSNSVQVRVVTEHIKEATGEKVICGPKIKKIRPEIIWPEKFTMKELLAANPEYTQPNLYLKVQEEIKLDKIIVLERVKSESGRGKPTCVYGLVKN